MQVALTGDNVRGSVSIVAAVSYDKVRVYDWPLGTLENRLFIMRELLERREDEDAGFIEHLPDEEDPYWDPIDPER